MEDQDNTMALKVKNTEMVKLKTMLTFRAKETDIFKQNCFINILKQVTSGNLKETSMPGSSGTLKLRARWCPVFTEHVKGDSRLSMEI